MRPRPRSRTHAIEYVPPLALVEQIRGMRAQGLEPEAIVSGRREWDLIRVQPEARPYLFGIIAEEMTLDGVPVIVRPRWARPVVLTRDELEEALSERQDRR
jgi:hypothetical protein